MSDRIEKLWFIEDMGVVGEYKDGRVWRNFIGDRLCMVVWCYCIGGLWW